MTVFHYIGAMLIIAIISAAGVYSGKRVKSTEDFVTGGRRAGAGIVTGSVIGTLVGGASTIGTAQLAYVSGLSALWFTLGGGIGCVIMAMFFMKPVYRSGTKTLPQLLALEYGRRAAVVVTALTSLGSLLSIVSQVLSGIALMESVMNAGPLLSSVTVIGLMLFYVTFGGVWGAGIVGTVKTVLLCLSLGICGGLALFMQKGVGGFTAVLPANEYFNLFGRGLSVEAANVISVILGIMSGQAYISTIISARNEKTAAAGFLAGAVIAPLIRLGGASVGMYMRINYAGISPPMALPMFIIEKVPPVLGGIMLATLLLTLVGSGASVALGISTMFTNDIYKTYINKGASDKRTLAVGRVVILCVLGAASLFGFGSMGSMILNWSFMSMGFRGAVAACPLVAALFFPGKIPGRYALLAMLTGPALVLLGKLLFANINTDPIYFGVGGSVVLLILGYLNNGAYKKKGAY